MRVFIGEKLALFSATKSHNKGNISKHPFSKISFNSSRVSFKKQLLSLIVKMSALP